MCAQQVGQLQDVGRPVLLLLEWAEFLGRRADPISDGGGRRCMEQTDFEEGACETRLERKDSGQGAALTFFWSEKNVIRVFELREKILFFKLHAVGSHGCARFTFNV